MPRRFLALVEPFILMLLSAVLLASILPARGRWAPIAADAADIGIVALFFLHGAKLSREAIWAGMRQWRLHLAVLASTFVLFPLLGVGLRALPGVEASLGTGLLFLTLLPSTVQSSIAFTAIARGNVAAAVCSASFSNLLGILITPALAALLIGSVGEGQGGGTLAAVETIVGQLLAPFLAGHLLRRWVAPVIARHKSLVGVVDRGSILLVVYTAFGVAVVEGLWRRVSPGDLALILVLCALLLAVVLAATRLAGKALGFSREDAIVLLFCGSKKSLASGVPMAGVLFPAAQVGIVLLPLMIFHQIQLISCAVIARRYADANPDTVVSEPR